MNYSFYTLVRYKLTTKDKVFANIYNLLNICKTS